MKPADEQAPVQRLSRLPRRPVHHPSVAELVRKYQDFLPPQGVHDLTKTAFAPRAPFSESEQEYTSPAPRRQPVRNKSRHRVPSKKASFSDFEQGYAANIAPRYLTHSRRTLATPSGSRIPGPAGSTFQSQESSRRASPEKRSASGRSKEVKFSRPSSPTNGRHVSSTGKPTKQRISSRSKEKTPARPSSNSGNKSTFRRPPTGPAGKVSNIAKHFERLGRDAERSKSRYSVIRGKRARPVASARAKVEILDSVKDAIKDESESSDSSEADDEDEGVEEERTVPELLQSSPESNPISPEAAIQSAPPEISFPNVVISLGTQELEVPLPEPVSLPPSPFLSSTKTNKDISMTPPTSDVELSGGLERNSILRAISGLWLQQPLAPRHGLDDDPMSDPEHIFRDSSMVVRTDEPTSIIALALR